MATAAEVDQTTDEGGALRTCSLPFAAALVVALVVEVVLVTAVVAAVLVVTPVDVVLVLPRGGTVARAAGRPAWATGVPRLTARASGARRAAWHDGRSSLLFCKRPTNRVLHF